MAATPLSTQPSIDISPVSNVQNHKTGAEGTVQDAVVTYTQSIDWIAHVADIGQLSGAARLNVIEKASNLLLYVPAALPGFDGLQPAEGSLRVGELRQALPHYLSELAF